jgi:broad specificity phosphatase PhoE
MALPKELVLLRHGESEGNVAIRASKKGDDSYYTAEFRSRHSSTWRLTECGRQFSIKAGAWIREHIGDCFDGYFVSEYFRARETAALLNLPDARWHTNSLLIERNRGLVDIVTRRERDDQFPESMEAKRRDPYTWQPPGGASMIQVRSAVNIFLNLLHRDFDGKRVIVVTHGEVMDAFRMTLEDLSIAEYNRIKQSQNPKDHTHNCQIHHFTRRQDPHDPLDTNLTVFLGWVRSIFPLDPKLSTNSWKRIERKLLSNDELLASLDPTRPE